MLKKIFANKTKAAPAPAAPSPVGAGSGSDALERYEELKRKKADIPAAVLQQVGDLHRDLKKPALAAERYTEAAARYVKDEAWTAALQMVGRAEKMLGDRSAALCLLLVEIALGQGEYVDACQAIQDAGTRLAPSDGLLIERLIGLIDRESTADPEVEVALAEVLATLARPDRALERLKLARSRAERARRTSLVDRLDERIREIEPAAQQSSGSEVERRWPMPAKAAIVTEAPTAATPPAVPPSLATTAGPAGPSVSPAPSGLLFEPPVAPPTSSTPVAPRMTPPAPPEPSRPAADVFRLDAPLVLPDLPGLESAGPAPRGGPRAGTAAAPNLAAAAADVALPPLLPSLDPDGGLLPPLDVQTTPIGPAAAAPAAPSTPATPPAPVASEPFLPPLLVADDPAPPAPPLAPSPLVIPGAPTGGAQPIPPTVSQAAPATPVPSAAHATAAPGFVVPAEPQLAPESGADPVEPPEAPIGGDAAAFIDLAQMRADRAPPAQTQVVAEDPRAVSDDGEAQLRHLMAQLQLALKQAIGEDEAETHCELGVAWLAMGEYGDAVTAFQAAFRNPRFRLQAAEGLAEALLGKGAAFLAHRAMRMVLEEHDAPERDRLGLYYWQGRAAEAMGRSAEALELYERVAVQKMEFRDVLERCERLAAA